MNRNIFIRFFNIILFLASVVTAEAFDLSCYAHRSRLSEGKWRKVSVDRTGMHFISRAQLKSMGFNNPEKVIIAGYGAAGVPDVLSAASYVDDLPEVQCERTADGIYFYAVGPQAVSTDKEGTVSVSLNPYTSKGYYYIGEGEPSAVIAEEGRADIHPNPVTVFTDYIHHELDKVNYGSSGTRFFGEDFRFTNYRDFPFTLKDAAHGGIATVKATFATKSATKSNWSITVKGETRTATVAPTPSSDYGVAGELTGEYKIDGESLDVRIAFTGGANLSAANLDAITVNYPRNIRLDEGILDFGVNSTAVKLAGADKNTRVWDTTDPLNVIRMKVADTEGGIGWINDYTGQRSYSAWTPGAKMPAVSDEGPVAVQNLHALSTPEMVIITLQEFQTAARRIAALHEKIDSMKVAVVMQNHIFNEFSSGATDPGAFRRFLKMLYDRGPASGENLRYALFLGRGTFDMRGVTAGAASLSGSVMPLWQSDESLLENVSYTTDDFFAFLEDNSGLRPGADKYCIAVGRIPARSATEAEVYVDKLESYVCSSPEGEWHNRVIMTADDGDRGIHLTQADELVDAMRSNPFGSSMIYDKVYIDAYPLVGGVCQTGREKLHKLLDTGASWWTYTGHANKYFLTGQGIMTLNDLNSLSNRYLPVFFGATCFFMQWDGFDQSGAEKMFFRPKAGVIAAISATRPVYISENSLLSRALGREAFAVDSKGKSLTVGDILKKAKNRLSSEAGTTNTNKLRFALMGDPAMRVATGQYRAAITHINDKSVENSSEEIVFKGRENVIVKGCILSSDGEPVKDFNGTVRATLYDAETSVTTLGRNIDDTTGQSLVFDEHGERLFSGRDSVLTGEFELKISMPAELADNYRNALISLNARSGAGKDAIGTFTDFYVFGSDENVPQDTVPPVISKFYINHPTFVAGDRVNDTPMVLAEVSDDIAINLSTSGIGRAMTLKLDGVTTFSNVADYFTPYADGTPGGTIAYPLSTLSEGSHDLTLRVFDTSGNATEATINFVVDPMVQPEIFDIYTDVNPASVEANFFVNHNRPDETLTVTVSVYNLMGMLVWSKTVTDRSDMFTSAPITWNLHDLGGRRVGRGIYIYRADVSVNGVRRISKGKRIAVTGK
ncbi:MAG: type IX secretion system sortase PorU [Paramuribaculum sp.]|nr:type IX secretion system sortase PorU [Paramuribaculum sp.]